MKMYRKSPPLNLEDFFPLNIVLNVDETDSSIKENNSDIEEKDLNDEEKNLCDACHNAQDGCPLPDHFIVLPCTCRKLTTKDYVALDELPSPNDPKLLTKDQGAVNTILSPRKTQALLSDLFSNVKKPPQILNLPDHNELLKLRRKNNHDFVPRVPRKFPNPILESTRTDCHESGSVEPNQCQVEYNKGLEIYDKQRSCTSYLDDHCYAKVDKSESIEEVDTFFDADSFLIPISKNQDDVIVEVDSRKHSLGAAESEDDSAKTNEEPIVIDEPTDAVINFSMESETKANSSSSISGTELDINCEIKLYCDTTKKRRVITIGDYKEKNKNVVDSNSDILSHIAKCRSALYGNLVPYIPKNLSSNSVGGESKENGTQISPNELTSKAVVVADAGANASIESTATPNVALHRSAPTRQSGKPKSKETHSIVNKKYVKNSSKEPWDKKLIRIHGLRAKPEKSVESKWPEQWVRFMDQVKLGNKPVEINWSKHRVETKNSVVTRLTPTISPTDSSSGVSSGGSPTVINIDEKCNDIGVQGGTNVVQKIPFAPDLELLRDYNCDKKYKNNKRSKSRCRRQDRREMSYDSDCYISDESRECKRTRYHEPSSHHPKYMADECSLSPMSYYNYQNFQEFNSMVPVNPHYVRGVPPPIYYHPQTLACGYPLATSHNEWRMPDSTEERRVLYVGNLESSVTENDIRKRFEKFGCIEHVRIITKPDKNYGFITYTSVDHVLEALKHGNDDENLPVYNLGFGGRKEFCDRRYMDLDNDK